MKIDYRDLQSGFYEFLQCPTPCFYSIRASLHSNGLLLECKEALIEMQRKPECNAKVVLLQ